MSKSSKHTRQGTRLILEELEQRRLFSGGAEGVLGIGDELDKDSLFQDIDAYEAPLDDSGENAAQAEERSHEVVFVDAGVDDYQLLVDDIRANMDLSRELEVVVLERDRDGIAQISEALKAYNDLDAIHIVSHGSDGSVRLGNASLNTETLEQNNLSIALWANAFSDIGDILFYGCNLAATENGQSLIDELGALTLTDVAASSDLTGVASKGGDWDLEFRAGEIETAVVLGLDGQQTWDGLLVVPIITARETVDSDGDGQIDYIRMTTEDGNGNPVNVNDKFDNIVVTVVDGAYNYAVTGYQTSIPSEAGAGNDNVFYVALTERGTPDTGATPTVTVVSNTKLKEDAGKGSDTLPVDVVGVVATDDVAPILISASTNVLDGQQILDQQGESLTLVFSESLSGAPTEAQLEAALSFAGGATDGNNLPDIGTGANPISLATTTVANDSVVVTFNANNVAAADPVTAGIHTVSVGDGSNLTDTSGNTANTTLPAVVIDGGANPLWIVSRETADLDGDGFIDAIHVTFSVAVDDSTIFATDWDVFGVTGEAFVSTTNGDTADDADIYITFADGVLDTAAIPQISYTQGTLTDTLGNPLSDDLGIDWLDTSWLQRTKFA
ncbi:MAG TPA: DUF4347 domain-containing protein, partial [Gammaproteobacteria bacterium]